MKTFDPNTKRRQLDGELGYEWTLTRSFEDAASKCALSHAASFDLEDAMQCVLVGYDHPAERLARRAREWLNIAVREDEPSTRFGVHYNRAQRHFNLAQCAWLVDGLWDQENLQKALEHRERLYAQDQEEATGKTGVSFAAIEYLDSRDYCATLNLLLRAGIGPPSSFSTIRTEGQMAYVLCRKQLGEAYVDAGVDAALAAFLKRNLNSWLIDGHYMRTALWMKVAHWREGGPLSPQETIRKAYDYLPGVARPDVVT